MLFQYGANRCAQLCIRIMRLCWNQLRIYIFTNRLWNKYNIIMGQTDISLYLLRLLSKQNITTHKKVIFNITATTYDGFGMLNGPLNFFN